MVAALVIGALVAVFLARGGGGKKRVRVASGATSSTTASGTPSSTNALPTPSMGSSGATTSVGRPTGAAGAASPGSTAHPATTAAASRTTSGGAGAPCTPSDLAVGTTTDQRSYARGATVTVTVTVTNMSPRSCIRPEPGYNAKTVTILDSQGSVVWSPPQLPPGVGPYVPPTTVAPGASYAYSTVAWDQHSCDTMCSTNSQQAHEGGQVQPGTYTAVGHVTTENGGSVMGTSFPFAIA